MTIWENVWSQVRAEMPQPQGRQRSWPGFFGALFMALVIVAIWFPIRLIAELWKSIDLTPKPDHRAEAQALFREAYALSLELPGRGAFAEAVLTQVDPPPALRTAFHEALGRLYADSMMLQTPPIPTALDDLNGIRWRDRMRHEIERMRGGALPRMRKTCIEAVEAIVALTPKLAAEGEITAPLSSLANPGRVVETLAAALPPDLFPAFADRYEENVYRLSGAPRGQKTVRPPKLAKPTEFDDPSAFLDGTPFAGLLETPLPVAIPNAIRNEHHWIVAGSGAGKTNALQYLIAKDLERAQRGECSLIVLDSQHQLIERLSSLKMFARGGALDGKLCLLDAADVEYPIAINLFDMKLDRAKSLSPLEREKLINSALDMYDFIIGSLLQSEMTGRQSTLFRFITRALFAIPGANIRTFHDILQNGIEKYQRHIDTLDETARTFFATDFKTGYKDTKIHVAGRLWTVLGNQTFMRMFSSPHSKIDLFSEINTPGKVILINAEKGLLKDEGTELFGRFFLALINQAAAQRSSLDVNQRLPCYVYVDECHNYIKNDQKIQTILAESRQQNIGIILSHQYLAQIDPPVLRALSANTTIKMAARLEGTDAQVMARDMNTVPNFIREQRKGAFAVSMRGVTPNAISMYFPLDALNRFPAMTHEERLIVRARNRATYANPISEDGRPRSDSTADDASTASSQQHRDRPDAGRRDPDA